MWVCKWDCQKKGTTPSSSQEADFQLSSALLSYPISDLGRLTPSSGSSASGLPAFFFLSIQELRTDLGPANPGEKGTTTHKSRGRGWSLEKVLPLKG